MPLVVKDRVNETSTTTGTGTFTLAGAVTGFQTFAAIGDGNTTYYAIVLQGGSEFEVGLGTYTSSGTTLSRDTILSSSNSNNAVNFSAGTKNVFCDYPAPKAVYGDSTNTAFQAQFAASNGLMMNNMTVGTTFTIPTGYSASSVGPVTVSGGVTITVPSGSRWVVL
jgi:hypothetical protein